MDKFYQCALLLVAKTLESGSGSERASANVILWTVASDVVTVQRRGGRELQMHLFVKDTI